MSSTSENQSNFPKVEKTLIVQNQLGLHARAAAELVKVTSEFRSEVTLNKDGLQVNGKSIMGIMMLAASKGSKIKVTVEGPDAEECMEAVEKIFSEKFGED